MDFSQKEFLGLSIYIHGTRNISKYELMTLLLTCFILNCNKDNILRWRRQNHDKFISLKNVLIIESVYKMRGQFLLKRKVYISSFHSLYNTFLKWIYMNIECCNYGIIVELPISNWRQVTIIATRLLHFYILSIVNHGQSRTRACPGGLRKHHFYDC